MRACVYKIQAHTKTRTQTIFIDDCHVLAEERRDRPVHSGGTPPRLEAMWTTLSSSAGLVVLLCLAVQSVCPVEAAKFDCEDSDNNLVHLREAVCSSLVQGPTSWCGESYKNVTADHDWPSQVVYMQNLLNALAAPSTCLNTSTARMVVQWLDTSQSSTLVSGSFMQTWQVFQV